VPNARVLDVGCGNDSPLAFKTIRPDLYYAGLDVGDHNHTVDAHTVADEYVIVPPAEFAAAISGFSAPFDAIVSAHNLEHCDDPDVVLRNITQALSPGGRLYLSFPSEASAKFPSRKGCLNFFDDPTHNRLPSYDRVLQSLRDQGMTIEYAARRYRPLVKFVQGLLVEPLSRAKKRVLPGTWALYGFETVIWARRPA
jgi:SAM-dependent methyltransferase